MRASGEVEIASRVRVSGQYAFSTPLRFRINGDAFIKGSVQQLNDEDIDSEIKDSKDESFEEAALSLRLINHTPLGGSIRLIVSTDPAHTDIYDTTYFNPALEFIKEVTVMPAPTDPVTGFVTEALENTIELSLNRQEFRLFKNPPVRIGYELHISGTNGDVTIRASDFVQISGLARVVVVVDN